MKINAKRTFVDFLKTQQDEFNSGQIVFNDKNVEQHRDIIKMN